MRNRGCKDRDHIAYNLSTQSDPREPSCCGILSTVTNDVFLDRYFPLSATKEILDEFKPLLCPYDVTFTDGFKHLEWFLPTLAVGEIERRNTWHLWFKEFFTMWESIHSCPGFEAVSKSIQ